MASKPSAGRIYGALTAILQARYNVKIEYVVSDRGLDGLLLALPVADTKQKKG